MGRLLDVGVIVPRLTELYRWSADELSIPDLTDIVSGHAGLRGSRRPRTWAPQAGRLVERCARPAPPSRAP